MRLTLTQPLPMDQYRHSHRLASSISLLSLSQTLSRVEQNTANTELQKHSILEVFPIFVANIPSDIHVLEIGIQGILQRFHGCSSACVSIQ